MKRIILFLFFVFQTLICISQWQNLSLGFNRGGYVLLYDTTDNILYVGGDFEYADSLLVNGFAKWNGLNWDSMGHGADFGARAYSITKFQNKIFASSAFYYKPPDHYVWLAKWNGLSWDTLNENVNGAIFAFKENNNELFIGGSFTKIGSQNANLLAKFDGVNFTPLNVPSEAGGDRIKAIEFFQGQMYIGGNFYDTITGVNDLERWDGTSFQTFGGNVLGFGSNVVSDMVVFQNNLYIGGNFLISSGAPGDNIMRWDGNQFHAIGSGLNGGVLRMKIYNNELYVIGAFTMAGSVPAQYLAKWDGNQWSAVVPGVFDNVVLDFLIHNNDLYITGGFTFIDSMPFNRIAKYSGLISVPENPGDYNIDIFPNPSREKLKIKSETLKITNYSVCDLLGKNVHSNKTNSKEFEIDLTAITSGVYFLQLETPEGRVVKKFVKE